MKLKSLILGSVAAAGLSTAGFAADLGVLTSLDVCDSLGISGLTISSADNCLAISGKVSYEFNWGDFGGTWDSVAINGGVDPNTVAGPDSFAGTPAVAGTYLDPATPLAGEQPYNVGDVLPAGAVIVTPAVAAGAPDPTATRDWNTKVESWLKFVGTASSDFGPASATIKLKNVDQFVTNNEQAAIPGGDHTAGQIRIDEAFVQVGDTTTIMAGKKGSIANKGDDEPFNWLGLYQSQKVDTGVNWVKDAPATGGHVIQVVSSLGNGITVKGGLEKLDTTGTAVGVIEYAGDGITAHVTAAAGGILDGVVDNWGVHAGFTGTFDAFKVRAAGAFGGTTAAATYWNVLGSVEGTFDMFTIALSGEGNGGTGLDTQAGFGASVGATITEGVKLNLGGRWFDIDTATANTEHYQVAAQIVAAVTETVTVTGEVGVNGYTRAGGATDFYGKAELGWKPGGNFESSLGATIQQNGAYKVTFKASKEFK